MRLNVSNPTLQDWTIQYRLGALGSPEYRILRQFSLQRGAQIDIIVGSEVEKAQLIGHLEQQCGARDAAEAHRQMAGFSGLTYRDNGVIEVEEIEQAHESDIDTRQDRSVKQAVRGALGFDRNARRSTGERPAARVTETVVEQELSRGHRRRGNEVTFGLTVDPEGRSDVKLPV